MKTRKNNQTIVDGRWYNLPKRGIRVVCCDCGATHTAEFRYKPDGTVQYRAFKILP